MDSEPLPHTLTAVLYADVAGYSRLTGADEDSTHRRLSEYLRHVSAVIEHHGGRVRHYAGDAVLASFTAVADALTSATQIQRDLAMRNAGLPSERKLEFRIGVNLGDVIDDRGDVYGDGVNVAARLEGLAGPGEVWVSESVRAAVGKRLPLEFEDLGELVLKNIAQPVRAYRVRAMEPSRGPTNSSADRQRRQAGPFRREVVAYGMVALVVLAMIIFVANDRLLRGSTEETARQSAVISSETLPELPASPQVLPNSIAVLPLENLSPDPDNAFFAAGMHEEILNQLNKLSDLNVINRSSVLRYGNAEARPPIPEIARALNVQSIMEGGVRYAGERIRVTIQLFDAQTGANLWSETYDRKFDDIFAIESDIATNVANALELEFSLAERQRIATPSTVSSAAYAYYLRALSTNDVDGRLRLLNEAVRLDPDFASAHGLIAGALANSMIDTILGPGADPSQRVVINQRARDHAMRALAIDPEQGDAHGALGMLDLYFWRWSDAKTSFDRAFQSTAGATIPWSDAWLGDPAETLRRAQRNVDLSPADSVPLWQLGIAHAYAGDYAAAAASLRESLALNPALSAAHLWLGGVEFVRGNIQIAREELGSAEQFRGDVGRQRFWRKSQPLWIGG